MADYKDILFNEEEALNEEDMKKYLQGDLSEEERHDFERKAVDSAFLDDAVEGLQHFKSPQKLDDYVKQLNKNLQQQLGNQKLRKDKRKLKDNPWALLAFIIILAICILSVIVIRLYTTHRTSIIVPSKKSEVSVKNTSTTKAD